MGRAEDDIERVCSLENITLGEEWTRIPESFQGSISVVVSLDRKCREQCSLAVEAEVQALIYDHIDGEDVVIYTDGSVIREDNRCSWAFTARCRGSVVHEACGAFVVTTSSMTMEVMVVTKALIWLQSQNFSHSFILIDSMSRLRNI